jgi:hypothetical protein
MASMLFLKTHSVFSTRTLEVVLHFGWKAVLEKTWQSCLEERRNCLPEKRRVDVHASSSDSETEIEFETVDSRDGTGNGEAGCLFCKGLFSHGKQGEKWVQSVKCYRWRMRAVRLKTTATWIPRAAGMKTVRYNVENSLTLRYYVY